MINIADLPAVRAQIEQLTRDIAEGQMQVGTGTPQKADVPAAEQTSYPARNLVFENGRYQVAASDK